MLGLSFLHPAIVWGFASTVGTTISTNRPMTTPGLENPALVAAAAMILGGIFGYLSEVWGDAMVKRSSDRRSGDGVFAGWGFTKVRHRSSAQVQSR